MKTLSTQFAALNNQAPIVILDQSMGDDPGRVVDFDVFAKLDRDSKIIWAGHICSSALNGSGALTGIPGKAAVALARWYNLKELQTGALASGGANITDTYATFLTNLLGTSGDLPALDSTQCYRRILANAPNNSVVIVINGPHSAFNAFYNSAADAISSLTGVQLIQAKVRAILVCGGDYTTGTEANFIADAASLAWLNSVPTDVCVHNFGALEVNNGASSILAGSRASGILPAGHVIRRVFTQSAAAYANPYASWALINYLANYKASAGFTALAQTNGVNTGSNTANTGSGANNFTTPIKNQVYVTRTATIDECSAAIDAYLYREPVVPNIYVRNMDSWVAIYVQALRNAGTSNRARLDQISQAATAYVQTLRDAQIWQLISAIWTPCGDNLASALLTLKTPVASARNSMVNTNFVEADFRHDLGLNPGAAGSGKFLSFNLTPTALGLTTTSHAFGFYSRTDLAQSGGYEMGAKDSASASLGIAASFSAGVTQPVMDTLTDNGSGRIVGAAPLATTKCWIGSRTAAGAATLYRDNASAGGIGVSAGTLPTGNFLVFQVAGGVSCGKILSHAFVGQGLTAARVAIMNNAITDFETALGRNV